VNLFLHGDLKHYFPEPEEPETNFKWLSGLPVCTQESYTHEA
jgi:hypothetical protein